MAQFPEELIVEIFLWLPARSLLRFRCVSKSLRAIIDSPDFINSHLASSSQSFNHRKLIFQSETTKIIHTCDVNFGLEEEEDQEEIVRLENAFSYSSRKVYGYCKGLLLLSQDSFHHNEIRLVLYNPSTGRYKDLPGCKFQVQAVQYVCYKISGRGLGYDDSTDEYKAFLMVNLEGQVQVWINGLKSNVWRRAQNFNFNLTGCSIDKDDPGYFTDGSLHWLCTISSEREILAFDMREETFSLCTQPVCLINSIDENLTKLHVLEGRLCITYFSRSVWPVQADLHMRKKDGFDQFTWIQIYSIMEPFWLNNFWLYRAKVLGYSKRGDKILLDLGKEVMVSYDVKDKTFRNVELYKDFDCSGSMLSSCLCIDSLVSVDG